MRTPRPAIHIRGTTGVVAILGDPVEHSRSPAIHNAAFAELGLDFVYVALRVRPPDLRRAMLGVRALGVAGLNVTVPHKEAIVPLVDRLSPAARAIGAVNTVVRRGPRLEGHNTDAEGFRRAVAALGFRSARKRAVLLGAGGSARAVAWALAEGGIRSLTILNRRIDRARRLARMIRRHGGLQIETGALNAASRSEVVARADLIVNCTSLGLDGTGIPPVAIAATPKDCIFYDVVYGAGTTPLVRAARRQGRQAADGLGMLLEQAGLAFRLWTGREPPLEAMRKAIHGRWFGSRSR
jgi:shikimate dehydrogenase